MRKVERCLGLLQSLAMRFLQSLLLLCFAPSCTALTWANWDARQVCSPQQILAPRSEAEVQAALHLAEQRNASLKVAGDGHSFSPIVLTSGILLDLVNLNDIVYDPATETVTAGAGARIHAVSAALAGVGRALPNLGAISMQSIAGKSVICSDL